MATPCKPRILLAADERIEKIAKSLVVFLPTASLVSGCHSNDTKLYSKQSLVSWLEAVNYVGTSYLITTKRKNCLDVSIEIY